MSQQSSEATAHRSTRGIAVITLAKAYFLVTGFAQPIVLTRLLGTEGYGLYGLTLNVVSILNNVVVAGSIQAMSRAVTEEGVAVLRRGIALHLALGLGLAGALVALAGPLGAGVLHDARLPSLLRLGAVVVANYSVYAALVGAINGSQRFRAQAGLDMTFATLRTGLIIGLAAAGLGVAGAVGGFAAASTAILLVALAVLARDLRPRPGEAAPRGTFAAFARRYGRFFAPVLLYQLALNLVLQADLLVLKTVLSRGAALGDARVNELAGIYKSVQNFAFLPYQLLVAVTFVVFPVVSRATLDDDPDTTRRFVHGALRFSLMALGAMLAVVAGVPRGVLRLAYRPPIDEGHVALRVLSLGQGAFALAVIGTTIILAAGRTGAATTLMALMLAAVLTGDVAGLLLAPPGIASLGAVAAGTAAGCAIGLALVGVYTTRTFGGFIEPRTAARVGLATFVAAAVGAWLPLPGKVGTLAAAVVVGLAYVAMLVVTREVGRAELALLARVAGRRKA